MSKSKGKKKKVEVDAGLLRSKLEHAVRAREVTKKEEKLATELGLVKAELRRYQGAWQQITATDQRAREVLSSSENARYKVEELERTIEVLKKDYEELEETLKKEKREKQLALMCVHSTEKRLTEVSQELVNLRNQHAGFENQTVELKLFP